MTSPFLAGALENLFAGDHHPEVDDFVVVARQHHAHDVLADVVTSPFTVAIRILAQLPSPACFSASMNG